MDQFRITQETDVLSTVRSIGRKNKKMQAILLQHLEQVVAKDSKEYEEFRKVILDESNNNARAVVRLIFGDIEYTLR
jgi:uncharacterized protein YPO0396